MAECADMVLDGFLDWDGIYSGKRNSTTHYIHKQQQIPQLSKAIQVCKSFGCRNAKAAFKKIFKYGELIGKETAAGIAKHIYSGTDKTEYNKFKKWLKEEIMNK